MSEPKNLHQIRDIQEKLQEFRQRKQKEDELKKKEREEREQQLNNVPPEPVEPKLNRLDYFAIDVLNFYPLRKWREWLNNDPVRCWIATGCFWLTGFILMIKAEFGIVYFISSLFFFMFLNLGSRKEGEVSAYSVFNPNCERLLGQMTSEHFERDMMMRRNADEE